MQQQMHHQQMVQQDQIGNPQQQHNMVQQQMMLCPVRLVYETPFIVQQGPGEQVQNQNIFINPQNPPPWARPVQNQVIYVQQLQPNMMPIQQMDPNQLYLQQNLANYQQLLAQQMLNQNSQDQRQLQMQMQMPNMMQNVQTLAPNMQSVQNEMPMGMIPNYTTQQQNTDINAQNVTQNQINLMPDPNSAPRQIASVQTSQNIHQNAAASQKAAELQRQAFYRNVVPQNQQPIIRPPMPMAMNQVQNMSSIQQIQQLANQNFAQNIRPAQNPIQPIVQQQNVQPVMINTAAGMQTPNQERANVPQNTVTYSAVRNGQSYTFRAIQPKPPPYRNFAPMPQAQRQNAPPSVHNMNTTKPNHIVQRPPTNTAQQTQTYKQPEPQSNRKRKSESPDEISKKVSLSSTVYGSITVTPKVQDKFSNKNNAVSYDIGVNTNPIFKPQFKMDTAQAPVLQINPMDVQVQKIKEEYTTQVDRPQNVNEKVLPTNPVLDVKDHLKATLLQAEKERIARSTVFTQARGRVVNDKPMPAPIIKVEEKPIQVPKESSDAFTQTVAKKVVENKGPIINTVKPEPVVPKIEIKPDIKVPKIETKLEDDKVKVKLKEEPLVEQKNTIENNNKVKQNTTVPAAEKSLSQITNNVKLKENDMKTIEKTEKVLIRTEKNTNDVKEKIEFKNISPKDIAGKEKHKKEYKNISPKDNAGKERHKKEYKNISSKDIKGKEIHITNGNVVKEDKDFVLTHVLDGYVIQESNVPFAIRKPLKERTIPVHTKIETDQSEESKTDRNDKLPSERVIKDNSKILDLSHLQLNDGKVEEKEKMATDKTEETNLSDSPFSNLKSGTVKSWTVEQLTDHLASHNWLETANILREHEIDGESLFLVSKSQLLTIGVKDDYADLVCEFVSCK